MAKRLAVHSVIVAAFGAQLPSLLQALAVADGEAESAQSLRLAS
jgi:hypothetical protein